MRDELLFAQTLLFVGVGAVIPTVPIYGKSIGLSSSLNGVVISAPAIALTLLAQGTAAYLRSALRETARAGLRMPPTNSSFSCPRRWRCP